MAEPGIYLGTIFRDHVIEEYFVRPEWEQLSIAEDPVIVQGTTDGMISQVKVPCAGTTDFQCESHPLFALPERPFLPADLVSRLRAALEAAGADLAVAKTGEQAHPVFCLMRRGVHRSLEAFLASGQRKIDKWYAALAVVEVAFDDEAEAFANINTRDELADLEKPT